MDQAAPAKRGTKDKEDALCEPSSWCGQAALPPSHPPPTTAQANSLQRDIRDMTERRVQDDKKRQGDKSYQQLRQAQQMATVVARKKDDIRAKVERLQVCLHPVCMCAFVAGAHVHVCMCAFVAGAHVHVCICQGGGEGLHFCSLSCMHACAAGGAWARRITRAVDNTACHAFLVIRRWDEREGMLN